MTSFDPYQPERQVPAPVDPAWQQYPPSAPVPHRPHLPQQWGPQPYPVQPYAPQSYAPQPYPMAAYPMLRTSGMAVAGMVVGIVALVTFWVPFLDLLLGFLAIGLSWAGMLQADR